jgi:succinoglycan biosynthesis transport protein ExoP
MFHRSKKIDTNHAKPLVVPSMTMGTAFSFPEEVISSMRYLITRLTRMDALPKRLSILAALSGEGVTYVSRALAATIANDLGLSVCVVDLNWWFPSNSPLASHKQGGLAEVLSGEATLNDALVHTGWPNLSLLPAGQVARQHRPILAHSKALKKILQELNQSYDHLVLDIPAILGTVDAVPLASLGTACCMVVQDGVTWSEDVKLALDQIDHLSIVGVVLNKVKLSTPPGLVKMISAN